MKRRLKFFGSVTALMLIATATMAGQTPRAAPGDARFDIADVHSSPHSSSQQQFMRNGFYRGGRYEIRSGTMVDLIALAYGVDNDKVLSGPNWLDFDRFDILATAPAKSTPAELKTMLQALLAERFSLVVHVDKKEMPTFALTMGKKSLLKEADGSGETGCQFQVQGLPNGGRGGGGDAPPAAPVLSYTCHNMSMPALAEYMHGMPLGNQFIGTNPLVDETGLAGIWNLEFHYELPMGPGGPSGAAMLDSFEKQTGLKLEARKVPLPVVVVDSANEKPTPNLPGVTEKLPVSPTEFEVADIKPSDPNASGPGRGGGFQPGGRLDLRGITLKDLITIAWDTTSGLVTGGPKFIETDKFDIVAKAPAQATTGASPSNGARGNPGIDIDALRLMLRALIIDRFKLTTHMEDKPMDAYTLLADKPKLKKADPSNRTNFKEGPGPDGRDPRKDTPALGRLVTCQNMTMAQFAELLPNIAGGYFQTVSRSVLDSTGLEGAYDFTLSFSGAGILNGGGGGGRGGGDAPPPPGAAAVGTGVASDPGGGITLMDALDKQIGIKMITTKRPVPVLVIDHIEQKPTDN
jgi:uncharacterized protein (TIGR03435 family)